MDGINTTTALATLGTDGQVPECRMKDARQTQDFVRRLISNDGKRAFKRSRLNGLVNGNPPYSAARLREAAQADRCNVNWGTALGYLSASWGSFYDLTSEAPGMLSFRTSHGNPQQIETWSNIVCEEADNILRNDDVWDYQMQVSQWDMVLQGCGPFLFEDASSILPRAVSCGDLKVPEFTKSDTHYWEACSIEATYNPPQLYAFITDPEAAGKIGWDVEYTRRVISNAMGYRANKGIPYNWEFYEQEVKNNAFAYVDEGNKVMYLSHVYWKEFSGRITHAIVERDLTDGLEVKYLYINIGRYASFQEAIHPMYFDHGNGGYHHSVTGLGVKMFSAMEYENRLICNLCDKAFSPKVLFKPTTTETTSRFSLAQHGDWATLPPGYEVIQNPINGYMNEGLTMHQTISGLVQSNLSSYRQQVPTQKSGNPVTKFEKELESAQQSALSKTQFNRYYKQLDMMYAEVFRRLSNPNTSDERAKEFQKRCLDRGVPMEALQRVAKVQACRVVGQGSAFTRKQAIDSIFGIAGSLPEEGRDNLIMDKIAAEAGQGAVQRYYPRRAEILPTDQQAEALQWVAAMKVGVAPVVTSTQNPVTYAATFMKAATDALQSLQQGGEIHEVLAFLNIAGPAIAAQLQRFQQDITRQSVYKVLVQQWKQLAKVTDDLNNQMKKMMQDQQAQQQDTQQAMTDAQLEQMKAQNDIQMKTAKTNASLQQSQEKHNQKLIQSQQDHQVAMQQAAAEIAMKDAETASRMQIERILAQHEMNQPSPSSKE